MDREQFLRYENKNVRLVFSTGFVLYGHINKVFSDSIEFTTPQKTSLIRFERIYEISEDTGGKQ